MTAKPKKKLCWNCEGRVTFQDENCPYCGVYLSPLSSEEENDKQNLFAPPYRVEDAEEEEESHVHQAPYVAQEAVIQKEELPSQPEEHIEAGPFLSNDIKSSVLPLVMLLTGSVCLLFGFALLLFAQHGTLTLHWSGGYWFLYVLFAVPLLFLGWRYLQHLDDSKSN